MPKIAIYKFLIFYIYSYDALKEPPHLHIASVKSLKQKSAKIWLRTLEVETKGNLTSSELNTAIKFLKEYQFELITIFENIKSNKNFKTIIIK